jgi:glycosyltransferase involved in cell wall biosynthesis
MNKSLSIIISAYNEEEIIVKSLTELVTYIEKHYANNRWEIIVIDDGSTDRTAEKIGEFISDKSNIFLLHHEKNIGQGRGFRTGFDRAVGEVIVTLDADLSYEPKYIGALIEKLENSNGDIAIVSPFLGDSNIINVPLYRKILTKCANRFLCSASPLGLSAITCAVRAYRREIIDILSLNSDGMDINLEIILKAQMLGLHVIEVPATLNWQTSCALKSENKRKSKMKVLRTVSKYFFFGYLFNPNILFLVPMSFSSLVFLIYFFSLSGIIMRKLKYLVADESVPILWGASKALRWTFANYTHAFYFLLASLAISFFLFVAWFISKQIKFYFEQHYSLGSAMFSMHRRFLKESEKKREN